MNALSRMSFPTIALTALLGLAGTAFAQAPAEQDHTAHHPEGSAPAAPAQPGGQALAPGNMAGRMMGGDMAQMMTMMKQMHGGAMPMHMGAATMARFRHIEGQIAFWKAELRITTAQTAEWDAFADTLRGSATTQQKAMQAMTGASGPVTAPEQIEQRIAVTSAQLDAMKAVLTAAKPLYAVLTDDQKKTADELMAEHMAGM